MRPPWPKGCAPTATAWSRPSTAPTDLAASLRDLAAEGDMIICMGAGDITKWAAGLADGIAQGAGVEEMSSAALLPPSAAS